MKRLLINRINGYEVRGIVNGCIENSPEIIFFLEKGEDGQFSLFSQSCWPCPDWGNPHFTEQRANSIEEGLEMAHTYALNELNKYKSQDKNYEFEDNTSKANNFTRFFSQSQPKCTINNNLKKYKKIISFNR